MKLILTRHTTTPWNLEGRWQGRTDIPLGEQGIKEAEILAELLDKEAVDVIYSSDLSRAKQTAEIIGRKKGVEVFCDSRLRECAFGVLEGLTKEEIFSKYGFLTESLLALKNPSYDFGKYGGESRDEVLSRHRSFVDELKQKHQDKTVLVVGHGRGLNTFLFEFDPTMEHSLKRGEYRVIEF